MIKRISVGLILSLLSLQAYCASDSVRSNHDEECNLYLCVPGAFGGGGVCNNAHSALIGRLTDVDHKGRRNYTALPRFSYCINNDDQPLIANSKTKTNEIIAQNRGNPDNIDYVERVDAHIPFHKECTHFSTRQQCQGYGSGENCRTITYCDAWKDVQEHFVEGHNCHYSTSFEGRYKYDDIGQIIGTHSSPEWCDYQVHVIGVTANGKLYGEEDRERTDATYSY